MIEFKIFNTHSQLPITWDDFVAHDVFLQSQYFKAVEVASPENISWYYVGIFKAEKLVGVFIVQRVQLYLEDIFRNPKDSCTKQQLKHHISKLLKGNILVVGNLMHTGQHGLFYDTDKLSGKAFINVVFKALNSVKKEIKKSSNKSIRTFLLKDYFDTDAIHENAKTFKKLKFHKVSVQPNMILPISWHTFDDYKTNLTKKYRQRLNSARKKASVIVKKELTLQDIETHQNRLFELYKNVSDNAKINTFLLPKGHFLSLKQHLGTNFKVFGYFLNDVLIGFYTLIINKKVLETYFLGYDSSHQYTYQLYLNMLYDMLEFGINNQLNSIVYARTAMEIKSSVGAKPELMSMYMKHTNMVLNSVLQIIFNTMNPTQDWEERHPFKS